MKQLFLSLKCSKWTSRQKIWIFPLQNLPLMSCVTLGQAWPSIYSSVKMAMDLMTAGHLKPSPLSEIPFPSPTSTSPSTSIAFVLHKDNTNQQIARLLPRLPDASVRPHSVFLPSFLLRGQRGSPPLGSSFTCALGPTSPTFSGP